MWQNWLQLKVDDPDDIVVVSPVYQQSDGKRWYCMCKKCTVGVGFVEFARLVGLFRR